MNHPTEDQLILHYYGDGGPDDLEPHLDECAECRQIYQTLQQVLNSLAAAPLPERGADYGQQVWRKVQLATAPRRNFRHGAFGLAAAAVVVVGAFLAGTAYERSKPVAVADDPRARLLRVALDGHLASSLMVLAEIENAPGRTMDISWQRQSAEQLLDDNRLYKQTASGAQESRVSQLLSDLEEILLEIAHSPARLNGPQLQELRSRIARKGIIFKIRIVAAEPAPSQEIL